MIWESSGSSLVLVFSRCFGCVFRCFSCLATEYDGEAVQCSEGRRLMKPTTLSNLSRVISKGSNDTLREVKVVQGSETRGVLS